MDRTEFEFWKKQLTTQRVYKYIEREIARIEDAILRAGKQHDKDNLNYLLGYRQAFENILKYEPGDGDDE